MKFSWKRIVGCCLSAVLLVCVGNWNFDHGAYQQKSFFDESTRFDKVKRGFGWPPTEVDITFLTLFSLWSGQHSRIWPQLLGIGFFFLDWYGIWSEPWWLTLNLLQLMISGTFVWATASAVLLLLFAIWMAIVYFTSPGKNGVGSEPTPTLSPQLDSVCAVDVIEETKVVE